MQLLSTLAYTAITLGVLVFVHELGHFLAAKLTGMRVDRFSIGFPPRAFGKKIGDTDYCISWIPLGGYVKIAGMVDESFDTEFTKREPEPWEFRSRPVWARSFVLSAGVIMNILLALGIFWGINFSHGRLIEETVEIGYVVNGSPAQLAGLTGGDKILSVNGNAVSYWDEIEKEIYVENFGKDVTLAVERNGRQESFLLSRSNSPITELSVGIMPAHTVVMIGGVEPGKPADQVGLKAGDIITNLAGTPILNDTMVIRLVQSHAAKPLAIAWKTGDEAHAGTVTPSAEGRIGIRLGNYYNGPKRVLEYSVGEAFVASVRNIRESTKLIILSLGQVFAGKSSFKDNFGGPIAIAKMATQSAESGFTSFISFMAMLSISLAFINILPFPALDGGHLMMLLLEKLFRREIPNRVKIGIQQAGFVILLAFMAFVIYNDLSRL